MKLASYRINGVESFGVASDNHIIDLCALAEHRLADNLLDLICQRDAGLKKVQDMIDAPTSQSSIPLDEIDWLPPVQLPGKICGIAMNNSASNNRKISAPDHPAFFLKPSSCLRGHKETITVRSYYGSVHPEPELCAVIGATTRDVTPDQALEYIFGYAIFNDITGNGMRSEDLFRYYALYAADNNSEALERREQHLSYAGRYKGTDDFGVMGPWLVTRDEIQNPDDLAVECRVGGEVVALDSTSYYNFKVAEVVSFISQFQTLMPGDVISFGTAFKPSSNRRSIHHCNLQVVDGPIEISIEGLGTQCSPVDRVTQDIKNWRFE